jgi:uncharacterized protein YidB (DUF937 family)
MAALNVQHYLGRSSVALDDGAAGRGDAQAGQAADGRQQVAAHLGGELADPLPVEADLNDGAGGAGELLDQFVQRGVGPLLSGWAGEGGEGLGVCCNGRTIYRMTLPACAAYVRRARGGMVRRL